MEFKEAQLVSNLTEHSSHSCYYLFVVVFEDKGLQEVWHEFLLNFVYFYVLKNFKCSLDCLNTYVRIFIIQ